MPVKRWISLIKLIQQKLSLEVICLLFSYLLLNNNKISFLNKRIQVKNSIS